MVFRQIALAAVVPFALQGCGTMVNKDVFEATGALARKIAAGQPATAWEAPFPHEAADFVQFLDTDRVLIGSIEVGVHLGVPEYKTVFLHDARTGTRLWQAERPDVPEGRYAVLALEPQILLAGTNAETLAIVALDPKEGRKLWEASFKSPLARAASADGKRLYVASASGKARRLHALSLDTGTTLWSTDVPATVHGDGEVALHASEDDVYVAGISVARIGGASGTISWVARPPQLAGRGGSFVPLADGVLAWSSRSIAFVDGRTGTLRWEHAANGPIRFTTEGDGRVIYVTGMDEDDPPPSGDGSDAFHAVDVRTGKLLWSRSAAGAVAGELLVYRGLLLVSLQDEVLALDSASGAIRFRRQLPLAFRLAPSEEYEPRGQLDVLQARDDVLYVARESIGIAAYSLGEGRELWKQWVNTTRLTYYPYSMPAHVHRFRGTLKMHKIPEAPRQALVAQQPPQAPSFKMQFLQSEQSRLASAYRSAGSRVERQSISRAQVANLNAQVGELKRQQSADRVAANLALAGSVASSLNSLGDAILQTAINGTLTRIAMQIDHTITLHHGAFQGRYYVRPFQNLTGQTQGAQGMTIIDLDTGARRDIIYSPYVDEVTSRSIDVPQIAVDPNGERLVTVGVGLNPERYQDYTARTVRQVRPSVLSYELGNAKWEKANAQLEAFYGRLIEPRADAWFVAAAAAPNVRRMQKLLNEGVPVDSKDTRGYTALAAAAEKGRIAAVRMLLRRGADVNMLVNGRTALDLAGDPDVRQLLVQAGGKTSAELPPR